MTHTFKIENSAGTVGAAGYRDVVEALVAARTAGAWSGAFISAARYENGELSWYAYPSAAERKVDDRARGQDRQARGLTAGRAATAALRPAPPSDRRCRAGNGSPRKKKP